MESNQQEDTQLREGNEKIDLLLHKEYNEFFSGPLPPPETLEGYERVVKGSAERILQMAERQVYHRHEIEKLQTEADIKDSNKGMNYALIISLFVIGCGTLIIVLQPNTGGYLAGSFLNLLGISSVISAFLRKDTPKKNDNKE